MMPNLSEPTRKRLVSLEYLLSQIMQEQDNRQTVNTDPQIRQTITSHGLAELTGWTDATIRRDISQLGIKCGASNGYNIQALREALHYILELGRPQTGHMKKCCIVGLGKFGAALLDYNGFTDSGFTIAAGFDASVNRVELLSATFPLYPASQLEKIISQEQIRYAILTVPDSDANRFAKRLAECGIAGIVNYTAAVLTIPASTAVENVSVVYALQNLNSKRSVS